MSKKMMKQIRNQGKNFIQIGLARLEKVKLGEDVIGTLWVVNTATSQNSGNIHSPNSEEIH